MRILLIGASSSESIAYQVGELLRCEHDVVYASRRPQISGDCVYVCDATNSREVSTLFCQTKPEVVVYAAGVYCGFNNSAPSKSGIRSTFNCRQKRLEHSLSRTQQYERIRFGI
jgi:hypothetical protein